MRWAVRFLLLLMADLLVLAAIFFVGCTNAGDIFLVGFTTEVVFVASLTCLVVVLLAPTTAGFFFASIGFAFAVGMAFLIAAGFAAAAAVGFFLAYGFTDLALE